MKEMRGMKVKFCGAVSSVTGSCHLLTAGEHQVLLDCGMYQGGKTLEQQNLEPFPFIRRSFSWEDRKKRGRNQSRPHPSGQRQWFPARDLRR